MINVPNFFRQIIIDHYNETIEYSYKDPETNSIKMSYYKEPVEQKILSDVFTVGFLCYILYNL